MILLILFTVLSGEISSPHFQEQAREQIRPPWFMVFEEKAAQGDRVQFLRAQKKAIDVWKQQNPDLPVLAWQNEDNTIYRVMPIFSFASIDTLYKKLEQVSEILKAKGRIMKEETLNPSTVSGTVMVWVPELSHHGETVLRYEPNKPYTQWMFVYLISGQEEAASVALKNFRDYYIDKKLDYPWNTFRVLLGNEIPLLIGMFSAESPAALQEKGDRIWNKHGDELEALWEDVVRHTWKIENKTGWFNSSLSNVPAIVPDEEVAGGF